MTEKTAVLFDFDGTLFFGTTDINYYAINMALRDMGLPEVDRATANSTVGDKLEESCYRVLGTENAHRAQELLDGLSAHTPEAIQRTSEIDPDCVRMLEALSKRAKLAICSNAFPAYLDALLVRFDIKRHFSYVWASTPGYDKERAIPEIMRSLGAERGIMVGDRAEDIRAGKANDCVTVAMQNDFGARDALGADYNVYTHAEMQKVITEILESFGGEG